MWVKYPFINSQIDKETINMQKIYSVRLHILNHGALKLISMSSNIKFNLTRLICKCMDF